MIIISLGRMDEAYVKVKGEWVYLNRGGNTIDFKK